MKRCKRWGRHALAILLAGAMLAVEIPAAMAADTTAGTSLPTTRLHLTPPAAEETQNVKFIQDQFNQSVIGYGAAGNSGSNVEGPNKTWNGPESGGSTDYVTNGNLSIIPAEEAGGADFVEDDGVFRFYLHDREDYDSTGVRYDRQRIEIKSHDRSDSKAANAPALAMEDEIYTYSWKFKLPENCYTPLSSNRDEKLANFFHIFQLKAIRGGENAMPVATFTIEDDYLMFQQIPISGRGMGYNNIIGDKIPLKDIEGKWLSATVTVLYRDEGYIHVKLDDMEDEKSLINTGAELDTWRRPELGEGATTFESDFPAVTGQGIRCKWGLYRKYIPDAYRLDPEAGGNSAINEAALPSWWKDATMWVGDIEVKREDRDSYTFPEGLDTGNYTLPAKGEGLVEHSKPLDGGADYARNAEIKICSKENNSHDGTKLLDGNDGTTWDTAKAMIGTDAANAHKVYWAALDLKETRDIDKFLIQFNTTSNKLCGYQIYYAGPDGSDAYEELQSEETDDPRELENWSLWTEAAGVGYHPGVNKYVKAYQMNIFNAASGDFAALEDVRYLLILGDVVHDNTEKSIKTAMFKAINTNEQPEIPGSSTEYDRGENLAAGADVKTSTSVSKNPSSNLTDGQSDTYWATNRTLTNSSINTDKSYKYWAAIDLGAEKEINLFRIKWGTGNGFNQIKNYQVFYSNQDDDFNNLDDRNTISGDAGPTKNPISVEDNHWKAAANRKDADTIKDREVNQPVEGDAKLEIDNVSQRTFEPDSQIENPEDLGENDSEKFEGSDNPDDHRGGAGASENTAPEDNSEPPKNELQTPQPEEIADEDLFQPIAAKPVYAALPSVFGAFARTADVSERAEEQPSITARYLLLLCDVDTVDEGVAINTVSFEAYNATSETTSVAVKNHAEKLGSIKMLPGVKKDDITKALLPERFSVELTGGIIYALKVEWDEDDIADLNPDKPGTYEIHGTLVIPEDVSLDFETNGVSTEIVREIVIEEDPKQEEVKPDDVKPSRPSHRPSRPSSSSSSSASSKKDKDDDTSTKKEETSTENTGTPERDTQPISQSPSGPSDFQDVQRSDWYADAVEYVSRRGVMNGSGSNFRPNEQLTRGMIAQVLYNLNGGTGGAAPAFPDVTVNDWCASAIGWASQNGVMSGYSSGLFGANDSITREQLAMTLYRYAQTAGYDISASAELSSFADGALVSDWAETAMRWAVANNLISGKSGSRLDAQGTATRAEVASILMRFCEMNAR